MRSVSENGALINKISVEDCPVHDWYRFVLSYPPHLVRQYLERFKANRNSVVLDPFCGTGTTIVECKKLGIPSIGIEANPMAHFASCVKVYWSVSPKGLRKHAAKIACEAISRLDKDGVPDEVLPLLRQGKKIGDLNSSLKTLDPAAQKLLLAGSISPLPLHKTLALLEIIKEMGEANYPDMELLALAKSTVVNASNLHFGPEVGVGKPRKDAPVVASWLREIEAMAKDLEIINALDDTPAQIIRADSRHLLRVIINRPVDIVITSPPYPNEKDYTRTTRLESVLLGFIENKEELRNLKKTLVRSNTRGIYKGDDDDRWIKDHPEIFRIADEIEKRRLQLGKTSGFERMYPRVTRLYFGGMARHLSELRSILRPGAMLAYVVGDQASYLQVMIRTGAILGRIAQSLGYELIGIDLFRTRLSTATKQNLREEVVVLRWP